MTGDAPAMRCAREPGILPDETQSDRHSPDASDVSAISGRPWNRAVLGGKDAIGFGRNDGPVCCSKQ